jgi:regulator of sirC expression with transglutaminase-like and TPR domain
MDKKAYAESAKCFRRYLELAPNASDAAMVRQQLPKLDELAGAPRAN